MNSKKPMTDERLTRLVNSYVKKMTKASLRRLNDSGGRFYLAGADGQHCSVDDDRERAFVMLSFGDPYDRACHEHTEGIAFDWGPYGCTGGFYCAGEEKTDPEFQRENLLSGNSLAIHLIESFHEVEREWADREN